MSKPRLFFVNRVYRPSEAATAQLLTDLAEALATRGWPVHVVAAGGESGVLNGVAVHRTGPGEHHDGLLSRAGNYRRFLRRAREELARLVQPGDVVVVMTDPPMLGRALSATVRERGGRIVHWVQDIYPEIAATAFGPLTALALLPQRAMRDHAWRSAARCVVLGEAMVAKLQQHGVPAERIELVPNWAPRELHRVVSVEEVAAQRQSWDLTGKFVVAYSGNLGRVHEFAAILAAARILDEQPDLVFLFIGSGARYHDVKYAVESHRLPNVRFLPAAPRETLATSLAAADAHFVTLKPAYESLVFPSKLAGVLAAGRPVLFVGPPQGEIARLLEREGAGVAVAPRDAARLAATIVHWQTDAAVRTQTGQQARTAYERHFTLESALGRWENILGTAGETP